jgi:hypothetical protein
MYNQIENEDGQLSIFAEGGSTSEGIDLFEDYDNIPSKVQKVLDKYEDAFMDGSYSGLAQALKAVEKIGYTFEYYLDGAAYDLRPIGTKGKSEDDEDYEKGGMIKYVFDIYPFGEDEDIDRKSKKVLTIYTSNRSKAYEKAKKQYPNHFVELADSYVEDKMADGGDTENEELYKVVGKKNGQLVDINELPMTKEDANKFVIEQGIERNYNNVDIIRYRGNKPRHKMAEGGKTTVIDEVSSMSFKNNYDDYEMVVISKDKDSDRQNKDRFLVSAKNIDEAKEIATKMWKERNEGTIIKVMSDDAYRLNYMNKMAGGGETENENFEMLESLIVQIKHHAKELDDIDNVEIEAWVLSKAQRAATDLSDITHYLEGKKAEGKMADGGYMAKGGKLTEIKDLKLRLELVKDDIRAVEEFINENGLNEAFSREWKEGGVGWSLIRNIEIESDLNNNDIKDWNVYQNGMMAKGGMVVTSIKDIPNFKLRLDEGKITYRGLGLGKLWDDFNKLTGTTGTRIKVDKKEYFITDEEFNTFSRGADGKLRIRFEAPFRKSYEDGGYMAKGGEISDINKMKKNLIAKAKAKGIYENFGQNEVRQLKDKYGYTTAVQNFNNWAMNFDLSQMEDGGYMAKGGKLIGKQKNLDVNKNGKLDAEDFKMLRGEKMAMGAKVTFDDKVSSIKKSLLKTKKVSPKVQKDYGKTYNEKEAVESAKRIAGSMKAKYKK